MWFDIQTSVQFEVISVHLIQILDAPEGQKPGMPINVTVDAVSGGWVIRLIGFLILIYFDLKCLIIQQMEEPWGDASLLHNWEERRLSVCWMGTFDRS